MLILSFSACAGTRMCTWLCSRHWKEQLSTSKNLCSRLCKSMLSNADMHIHDSHFEKIAGQELQYRVQWNNGWLY